MAFVEDLVKLRSKLNEAVRLGVIDDRNFADMYQASLIQVMNESERRRQECVVQIDDLKRKLAVMEGQEMAFARISNILFPILDGYINAAQKAAREEAEQASERAEKVKLAEEAKLKAAEEDRVTTEASDQLANGSQPTDDKKPKKRILKAPA